MEKVKISKVKPNPDNPRTISDEKFQLLVKSIKEFPEMLELRPIIVDKDMVALGGNMRLKACQELGLKEVFIIKAENLTEEQKKEFVIKDNASFGDWDWNAINTDWDTEILSGWGINVVSFGNTDMLDTVNKGDENDEWVGMPEFESKEPSFKIIVHFETEAEREKYAKKNKMEFTKKERGAWSTHHPFTGRDDLKSQKYE